MFSSTNVDVLVNGRPVKKSFHQNRAYIQANKGTEYTIRIYNPFWSRHLFVVTVDGINVVDGKAGGSTKMGYVVNGYTYLDVRGWRVDTEEVRPFKFSNVSRSYAAKSEETQGDTTNCGVIGIQIYEEVQKPIQTFSTFHFPPFQIQPYDPYRVTWGSASIGQSVSGCGGDRGPQGPEGWDGGDRRGSLTRSVGASQVYNCCLSNLDRSSVVSNFCAVSPDMDTPRGFDVGTEWVNRKVSDSVSEVEFDIGRMVGSLDMYYATRESLEEMGVPLVRQTSIPVLPQSFPSRFCKPPSNV